jgi:hypothetical protein
LALGMAAGTSPSIAGVGSTYEIAFQTNTGTLDSVGNTNTSWGDGLATGTSPSITALVGGGDEIAFQAAGGHLWTVGSTPLSWVYPIQAGTNPSIVELPGGGFVGSFVGTNGDMWTYSSATNSAVDRHLGAVATVSPSTSAYY